MKKKVFNEKYMKQEIEDKNNEKIITTFDSYVSSISITPAITKNSLPLNSNNSGNHSNITSNVKHLQNNKNIINKKNLKEKNLRNVELNDNNCSNEVQIKSINTSVTECIPVINENLQSCVKSENLNVKDTGINENKINLSLITPDISLNKTNFNTESINQSDNSQNLINTPPIRKRGRPKKIILSEKTMDISNKLEENLKNSQKLNDVSIAETVIHNRRHNEHLYNINNNDGLSNNNSTKDNIPISIIVGKRNKITGTSSDKAEEEEEEKNCK